LTAPQTGRIFISYRRADSAGYAGRIYDRLAAHFGKNAIFMDVDTIEAGLDFVEVLENAVQSCDVLLALIGRQWLNIKDEAGKRRLDNPQDFVRIEVAAALSRSIRVIPVLVDGAPMPSPNQLPHGLKSLARRNAVLVNHYSFHTDANRLIEQLELALKAAEKAAREKAEREAAKKAAKEKAEREATEKNTHEKITQNITSSKSAIKSTSLNTNGIAEKDVQSPNGKSSWPPQPTTLPDDNPLTRQFKDRPTSLPDD